MLPPGAIGIGHLVEIRVGVHLAVGHHAPLGELGLEVADVLGGLVERVTSLDLRFCRFLVIAAGDEGETAPGQRPGDEMAEESRHGVSPCWDGASIEAETIPVSRGIARNTRFACCSHLSSSHCGLFRS